MNILFIMYDQLRWDYLSCAGHPILKTPNFDRVAAKGVRFTQAYTQSPICGSSRMSFYTGRYVSSHGAARNGYPLRVGEQTLGDHMRAAGYGCHLIGKTHMKADTQGLARLGISHDSTIAKRQAECGFDAVIRDDGLWAEGPDGPYDPLPSPYNSYLKSKGYPGDNPWLDYANAGLDRDNVASGWFFENCDKPANIREEDSETPWLTRETIRFIDGAKGDWLAHVSYIKPHWPYIVPAPYHALFGPNDVPKANRSDGERTPGHPVARAFMDNKIGKAFQREDVRAKVIPAYMGLIKQCDDQLGHLLDHLEATGRADDTMIVLTSDHGDYLGDHWMGEKDLFHDCSAKIPLIIYDPCPEADDTRGTTCDALVEAIDLAATFIETAGGAVPRHIVEGRSLLPWIQGHTPEWRDVVISETDYAATAMATSLGLADEDARITMAYDGRWKLMHFAGGFAPMLFDLKSDPDELTDLASDTRHAGELERMYALLHNWAMRQSQRVTRSEAEIAKMRGASARRGILPFLVDGSEVPAELTARMRGKAEAKYTGD
ncbi:MAG: sulfatase-like hydrolase/transferase [Pseudomonadota bacterium]